MAKVLPNRILVSEFKYLKSIISTLSTLFTSLQLTTPITFAPGLQQSDIVFLKLRESQTLFPPNRDGSFSVISPNGFNGTYRTNSFK